MTLHYYSPGRASRLFDFSQAKSCPDLLPHEGVVVAPDGLVYPGTQDLYSAALTVSNGAELRSNTYHAQELMRLYYDQYYLEEKESGKQLEEPQIYTVAKGTQVPGQLMLVQECDDLFSLQPSRRLSLDDLNRALDDFYEKHAVKESAYKWFEDHPFKECIDVAGKDNSD